VVFFWRQERFSIEEWAAIRNEVDPDHNSLWIAEGTNVAYQEVFDGHHLYSIAWSTHLEGTLGDWGNRVRRYEDQHVVDRIWVATVMPGYNDTATTRADAFAVDRQGGAYYRQAWQAAVTSQPDWVVITSFNEWVEGSQIEPSLSYGNLYLDLTRELAATFKAGTFLDPTPTPTPLPESALEETETPADTVVEDETPPTPGTPTLSANETVRIRSGPGTQFDQLGRLAKGKTAPVVGINPEGTWWQIRLPTPTQAGDDLGWVIAEFVTLTGDVGLVPVVEGVLTTPAATTTSTPPLPTQTPLSTGTPAVSPSPTTMAHSATPAPSATPPSLTPEPTGTPAPTKSLTPANAEFEAENPSSPDVNDDKPLPHRVVGILAIFTAGLGCGWLLCQYTRQKTSL
jgi:uncharacterized protein YraI